jgi:proline racemase
VDRSLCDSGTSARLALLHTEGRLATKEILEHAGIVGTYFRGRVVGEIEVDSIPGVVAEVEGGAHLTGHHQFILEKDDPLGPGYLLR